MSEALEIDLQAVLCCIESTLDQWSESRQAVFYVAVAKWNLPIQWHSTYEYHLIHQEGRAFREEEDAESEEFLIRSGRALLLCIQLLQGLKSKYSPHNVLMWRCGEIDEERLKNFRPFLNL